MPRKKAGSPGARPPADEVLAKQTKAITLRQAGATYDEVAKLVGYANRQNARQAVLAALEGRRIEAVDEYRALNNARYERMIRTLWATAHSGDLDAMAELRRVLQDQNRLLGLNAPTKVEITDQVDAEIKALAAQLSEDGSWDITGIPDEPMPEVEGG